MLVISDTSVISNLVLIGRLELLFKLFDDVVIPKTVFAELSRLNGAEALESISLAVKHGRLKVELLNAAELALADRLMSKLDRGESEAIALAKLRKAELLLIDEAKGRQVACEHNLGIKGLLGLLLDAKASGHLNKIEPCLDELRNKAKLFMSENLRLKILELAGESFTQ